MILAAFYKYNLVFGISNLKWQICIFALGKLQISLSILPMTSIIMQVIPENIEASMFAVVSAALSISIEWGGDIVGALVCRYFDITSEDKSNFQFALMYKVFVLVLILCFSKILPTNQEIYDLAAQMKNSEDTQDDHKQEFKEYLKEKSEFEKMIQFW